MPYFNNLPTPEAEDCQKPIQPPPLQQEKPVVKEPHLIMIAGKGGPITWADIEDAPTALSFFSDDLGDNPAHTHMIYLTIADFEELFNNQIWTIYGGTSTTVL